MNKEFEKDMLLAHKATLKSELQLTNKILEDIPAIVKFRIRKKIQLEKKLIKVNEMMEKIS